MLKAQQQVQVVQAVPQAGPGMVSYPTAGTYTYTAQPQQVMVGAPAYGNATLGGAHAVGTYNGGVPSSTGGAAYMHQGGGSPSNLPQPGAPNYGQAPSSYGQAEVFQPTTQAYTAYDINNSTDSTSPIKRY